MPSHSSLLYSPSLSIFLNFPLVPELDEIVRLARLSGIDKFVGKSSFKLRNDGKLLAGGSTCMGESDSPSAVDDGGVWFICRGTAGVACGFSFTVGVTKKLVKLVEELHAEMIGVLVAERPRTGELGNVKLSALGELGLLFFSRCWT